MLRKSWDLNYQKLKRYNKWPYEFIITYAKRYIKNSKNKKVLDLGCGGGNNIKFLAEEKYNIYGIDSSETAIKLTKNQCNKKYRNQIILGDFKNLPYKNNFFDLIIDRMSITHNSEKDIELIINEVWRVMKKDAIFIGSFHSNKNPQLKYGLKKKNTYYNFKKGMFFYSNIVFAPSHNFLKKKFEKFKILVFKERLDKNLLKKNKETLSSHYIVVLKK